MIYQAIIADKTLNEMTTQPEQVLENNLVTQLQLLGYTYVPIKDERDLLGNLKLQLEKHNGIVFPELEFQRVLNI